MTSGDNVRLNNGNVQSLRITGSGLGQASEAGSWTRTFGCGELHASECELV